ncbi:MAG: ATP-binding protein [Clostridium sp.]|nr:ATP-binding protein [Clostridium sp.]
MNSKTVTAKLENLSEVMDFMDGFLSGLIDSEKIKDQICVSVEELFTNIVSYAYPDESDGKVVISCRVLVEAGTRTLQISLKDWGIPYNPLKQPEPDFDIPFENRAIGGLGIHMVRKLMDGMEYCYTDGCNEIRIQKTL